MKKQIREISHINLNAVKLLFQKVEEKIYPPNELKRYIHFRELARKISSSVFPNKDFEFEEDMLIQPKTLQRYWGKLPYGNKNRRYTPNTMSLDRLAEFCGYRNWNDFANKHNGEYVTNILPYEKNIKYITQGIIDVDTIPNGDVMYFGNEMKYIALLRKSNDVQLIDYKNIWAFQSFVFMVINGIEVIPNHIDYPDIRIIY